MNIEKLIYTKDYDFLKTNKHLGDKLIFLTLGGSYAYGTNIETSDVDVRGCCLNTKAELLGMSNFEQFIDNRTDTTIYGFNKLIKLLTNCNPNTIELLGCKKEHYFLLTPIAQDLINNRKMFLSQKAVNSFSGYAMQQLRRLQNFLARDKYTQTEKEKHIKTSIEAGMLNFNTRYTQFEEGFIKLNIDKSFKQDLEMEIFVDVNLKHYPLRDYKNIFSEINNIIKDYNKLNKRNKKKDNQHLNKHAMHLVRLYLMCLDILEKEEVITYRQNDLELLMSIRNGCFQNPDNTYRKEFFELIDDLEKRLQYAKDNTSLAQSPDYKKIEDFVIGVNEKVINKFL